MKEFSLNGRWHGCGISPEGKEIYFVGDVPGCVHTDLEREGLLRDPLYQKQSQDCQWIESWSWYYERTFTLETVAPNTYFRFEGLDTICEIYLNGKRIGSAENMFLTHTFLAKGLLVGENTIRVVFTSPVTYMADARSLMPPLLVNGFIPDGCNVPTSGIGWIVLLPLASTETVR